ncbi:hypothetical protein ABIB40_001687 [Pedobacter sp. UYP30]|uniref:hypothetical protein n=1 Tax=Pedobacter sp. UYP30 TaxID=1756400 RepID=UPI003392D366
MKILSGVLIKILCLTVLSATSFFAKAQIPSTKIYRLDRYDNNYSDAQYYAKQIFNFGDFYNVNIAPNKEVSTFGLGYALFSLDTLNGNGILKVAFLRDTVSKSGEMALQRLRANRTSTYYNEDWSMVAKLILLGQVNWKRLLNGIRLVAMAFSAKRQHLTL